MTLGEFFRAAVERWLNSEHERLGQAIFNHLLEVRPDLAEQIRGTELDPFHNDGVLSELEKWLAVYWDWK